MELEIRKLGFRFKDLCCVFVLFLCAYLVVFATSVVILTKKDVVMDNNYKGKYIKVKQYTIYNNDSTIKYFKKPIKTTANITSICKNHIHVSVDGYEYVVDINKKHHSYKEGNKIIVLERFYPENKVELTNSK